MDWLDCCVSGYECSIQRSMTYWTGDDGKEGAPVFAEVMINGEIDTRELYRGQSLEKAKNACEEHLSNIGIKK